MGRGNARRESGKIKHSGPTRQRQKNGEKFIARYYFPLDEQTSRRATFGTHCAAVFLQYSSTTAILPDPLPVLVFFGVGA